jgi:hypothetical protein
MKRSHGQERDFERIEWSGAEFPIGQEVSTDEAIAMARATCGCNSQKPSGDPGVYDVAAFRAQLDAGRVDEVDTWQAANAGCVSAMLKLVYMYGVQAQSVQCISSAGQLRDQMAKWLQRAVVVGSARAVGLLGMHLHEYPSCDNSQSRGIELLRLAAAAGDVVAMRNLGCVLVSAAADSTICTYMDSDGVEGAAWLARAAANGDPIAETILTDHHAER